MTSQFHQIDEWVFDLDYTLYSKEVDLFSKIETRMADFIVNLTGESRDFAHNLRAEYWKTHGTTLAGLMLNYQINPSAFLEFVEDIPLNELTINQKLCKAIENLPGRKIVYTNGSSQYANRVTKALGLESLFDSIFGIDHADFHPKPKRLAFETVFAKAGLRKDCAIMFEDDERNLQIPHEMGLQTVLVANPKTQNYVHHWTDDLAAFLHQAVAGD